MKMNQCHITRCGISLSLLAACLIVAAAFTGAFGISAVIVQTSSAQTNNQKKKPEGQDAPGVRHKLTPADLPPPFETDSAVNFPILVPQPPGVMPQVPEGFRVKRFAFNLVNPRMIRTAPNGDLFVAESQANRIRVLRDANCDGMPEVSEIFAEGLNLPFGIEFYPVGENPRYVYVANTGSIVRYPYRNGDTVARGPSETIVNNLPTGGHWTRNIVFSRHGTKMYVAVGSRSNVSDDESEARRARIFEFTPDGGNERVYAYGIRNPVGMAIHPRTGQLWVAVNERDELGDDLVPDYVTHVEDGGFYGWPWYYIGANRDPRLPGGGEDLANQVIVPDVLVRSHSASLGMTFYTGDQFPRKYRNFAFVALHGSWNRSNRTGYKVAYIPIHGGHTNGEYVDFMTGFVTPEGDVWGRPVAVAVGRDGALYVTDDGGNAIWRVSYVGRK
jgi:glucose/arabinose dehydrogenase